MHRSPHDRALGRLAVPALGALIAEPLYVLTDTAIVGHLGTRQLAGLSLATAVLLTGYSLFIFLAYGTTATVARLLGAGQERQAAHQAVQGLWLATIVGVILALAGWAGGGLLIDALGGEGATAADARLYLNISLLGFPALLISLAAVGYLRGRQDTRTPLLVAVATAIGNGVLEWLLIFRAGFGLGASAVSTVLAQWVATAVFVHRVLRATGALGATRRPEPRALGRLLAFGAHLAVRTAALRAALLCGVAVAARIGTKELAAYEIGFQIWSLAALALDAVAIAAQSLTGHALGAGDAAEAARIGRRAIEWGAAAGLLIGVGLVAARTALGGLFTDDPEVAQLLASSLVVVAAMQPLCGVAFSLDGILIGAGDLRFLAGAMIASFLAFAVGAALVHLTGAGLGWLWVAFGLFMATRAAALSGRFASRRWAVTGATR